MRHTVFALLTFLVVSCSPSGPKSDMSAPPSSAPASEAVAPATPPEQVVTPKDVAPPALRAAPRTGKGSAPKAIPEKLAVKPDVPTDEKYVQAKELIEKYNCYACHADDRKIMGPAFRDVAAKYPNTHDTHTQLQKKVIEGGAGVWGPVPMPANPQVSSFDDLHSMLDYILNLK